MSNNSLHPAANFQSKYPVKVGGKTLYLDQKQFDRYEKEQSVSALAKVVKENSALTLNKNIVAATIQNQNGDRDKIALSRQVNADVAASSVAATQKNAKVGAAVVGGGLALLWLFL